ncbi:hypothetical protein [Bradyrhizobium sp. RT10b]|uniref:hypothetical protein n=1 Tax=Bradyrhizobium sp. RT10b TaxID=3156331 RepID=UPI003397F460
MDKAEFVAEAPKYYAMAIASYIHLNGVDTCSPQQVQRHYTQVYENMLESNVPLLDNSDVMERAIALAEGMGLIILRKALFGPPALVKTDRFDAIWSDLCEHRNPFDHYSAMREGKVQWLWAALEDVKKTSEELGVTSADFEGPDTEWTPIQLDRDDPAVNNAIDKLSSAVEEIRKDNGYAATFPEEREFVLDGLTRSVDKLKSGTISAGLLRDAWNRLTLVSKRFAGAALELVITGAKQGIIEFVKSQGGELLRNLLHLFH